MADSPKATIKAAYIAGAFAVLGIIITGLFGLRQNRKPQANQPQQPILVQPNIPVTGNKNISTETKVEQISSLPNSTLGQLLELTVVIAATWLAVFSWSSLVAIEGLKPVADVRNDAFYKPSDYPKTLPAQFAIRHDCGETMNADLSFLTGIGNNFPKYKSAAWRTLSRQAFGWPPIERGLVAVTLKLLPSGQKPYPCKHIAIHVPGKISGVDYEIPVPHFPEITEDRAFKSIHPVPAWGHGASILIDADTAPGFVGTVRFLWDDEIQVLGDETVALTLPIGAWGNLDPEVKQDQSNFLVHLQTPQGYKFSSANYHPLVEDKNDRSEFDIKTFQIGLSHGLAPLTVVFTDEMGEATKANRLVFWSTLFGAAVAIIFESLLAMAKRLLDLKSARRSVVFKQPFEER